MEGIRKRETAKRRGINDGEFKIFEDVNLHDEEKPTSNPPSNQDSPIDDKKKRFRMPQCSWFSIILISVFIFGVLTFLFPQKVKTKIKEYKLDKIMNKIRSPKVEPQHLSRGIKSDTAGEKKKKGEENIDINKLIDSVLDDYENSEKDRASLEELLQEHEHHQNEKDERTNDMEKRRLEQVKRMEELQQKKLKETEMLTKNSIILPPKPTIQILHQVDEEPKFILKKWLEAIEDKRISHPKGLILLHFDSHPAMNVPRELPLKPEFKPDLLNSKNFIIPMIYWGFISKVIWVKPPWSSEIQDGVYKFRVGNVINSTRIAVTRKNIGNFFLSYSHPRHLTNMRKAILEVITLPTWMSEKQSYEDLLGLSNPKVNVFEQPPLLNVDLDYFACVNPRRELLQDLDDEKRNYILQLSNPQSYCIKSRADSEIVSSTLHSLAESDQKDDLLGLFSKLIPFWCKGEEEAKKYFEDIQVLVRNQPDYLDVILHGNAPHYIPSQNEANAYQTLFVQFIRDVYNNAAFRKTSSPSYPYVITLSRPKRGSKAIRMEMISFLEKFFELPETPPDLIDLKKQETSQQASTGSESPQEHQLDKIKSESNTNQKDLNIQEKKGNKQHEDQQSDFQQVLNEQPDQDIHENYEENLLNDPMYEVDQNYEDQFIRNKKPKKMKLTRHQVKNKHRGKTKSIFDELPPNPKKRKKRRRHLYELDLDDNFDHELHHRLLDDDMHSFLRTYRHKRSLDDDDYDDEYFDYSFEKNTRNKGKDTRIRNFRY